MDVRQSPAFNVKAVSQETGVKADTLRAWERRYGMPVPSRSQGGHRLYSAHDVELVKWLVARQDEGLTISNAVDLWKGLVEAGHDPLTMPQYAADKGRSPSVLRGESIDALRRQWVVACLAYDEAGAEAVVNQAFAVYPMETAVIEILQAGLAAIGQDWYQGTAVVQQEHFASELAVRRIDSLLSGTSPASRRERLLFVCPPEERHTFGLQVLALLMRRRGWPVVFLGANVPINRLQEAVEAAGPNLVVAVAQQLATAASLRAMAESLRAQHVPLAYGGTIFTELPALQNRIPGHYLADRIQDAPRVIENLVAHPQPIAVVDPIPPDFEAALAGLRHGRSRIDQRMQPPTAGRVADNSSIDPNPYMAASLEAALRLGSLDLLDFELDWLAQLMSNHQADGKGLSAYLRAYQQAVEAELGEAAGPVRAWLAQRAV